MRRRDRRRRVHRPVDGVPPRPGRPGHAHRRDRARDRRLRPVGPKRRLGVGRPHRQRRHLRALARARRRRAGDPRDACRRRPRRRGGRARGHRVRLPQARLALHRHLRAAARAPARRAPRAARRSGSASRGRAPARRRRVKRDRAGRAAACRRRSPPTPPASTRPGWRAAWPTPASGSESRSTSARRRPRSGAAASRRRRAPCAADVVLQATEAYSVELPGQRLRYLPLYSLMIATEPLPAAVWDELGWTDGVLVSDSRYLFFYAQRTADGRIALGGRGAPYQLRKPIDEGNERNAEVRSRLERAIRRHFPAAAEAADHPPLGRAARRAPRLVDVHPLQPRDRVRLGRRLRRPRRRRREHLRPHARRSRARPRHRSRQPALGRPPQPPVGARAAALRRLARDRAGCWGAPTAARTRPGGAPGARACSPPCCRRTDASRGATRVRPCRSHSSR